MLLWYFACGIYVDDFTKRKQCCRSLLYYTSAYALTGIAAFSVILYVCKDSENEDITNFHGLGKTNPLLAAILTASLLSMAGILFSQGFF
jgi:NADH-quinone oxidoreductase subunit N